MGWLSIILGFLKSFAVSVFMKAQETPAVKEKVDVEEGNLSDLDPSEYDGLYGVHDRDKENKDDRDDKPTTDS